MTHPYLLFRSNVFVNRSSTEKNARKERMFWNFFVILPTTIRWKFKK